MLILYHVIMMGLVIPPFFISTKLQMILKIIQTNFLPKFYYDTYTYNYTHKNLWHNMNT